MTRNEAIAITINAMRRRWRDEALPAFDTPEHDELMRALQTLVATAMPQDLADVGLVAVRLLYEHMEAAMQAQREMLQVQLAIARGDTPPHSTH